MPNVTVGTVDQGLKLSAHVLTASNPLLLLLDPPGVRYISMVRRGRLGSIRVDTRATMSNAPTRLAPFRMPVEGPPQVVTAQLPSKSKLKGLTMNVDSSSSNLPTNLQTVIPTVSEVTVPLDRDSDSKASIEKEFDAYAAQYESALNEGLSVSGEGPEYFAQMRVNWVANRLNQRPEVAIKSILDFGCGVGIATPLLEAAWQPDSILGFDPSSAAIERANRESANGTTGFTFSTADIPSNHFDLAYCNGVFHHILPQDRQSALQTVFRSLKPGGWFAFWENNPWNPGTRYVMSKIPFDRDAIVISPLEARQILKRAGFQISRSDAWFIFPRSLRWLRPLERLVYRLPLGAQYLILAQKPTDETSASSRFRARFNTD